MRKKDETLRDTLLDLAREVIQALGPDALNIRALAKKAGVASGTVYNYFANKDDILLALTEDYWHKTLYAMHSEIHADSFSGQLREIYTFLKRRISDSAGMLMDSLANVQAAGRLRMQSMQEELRPAMIMRMHEDKRIRQNVWNDTLTEEQFADFIIMNMMALLRTDASGIDSFIEIVERILY